MSKHNVEALIKICSCKYNNQYKLINKKNDVSKTSIWSLKILRPEANASLCLQLNPYFRIAIAA